MLSKSSNPGDTGLTFFSRVSAAVSHEIKNVLAIINENAGLLEDLVLMSEKGSSLSPERLRRLAVTVRTQIKRADEIVKTLNQFAHSADHSIDVVDLYDAAVFITGVRERIMRSKNLIITIIAPDSPVTIHTNLFYLQEFIFMCIETIISFSESVRSIRVEFQKTDPGAEIRFVCEDLSENLSLESAFSDDTYSLMSYLKVEPIGDNETGEFRILLPASIQS